MFKKNSLKITESKETKKEVKKVEKEDYLQSYETVLTRFKEKKITKSFRGYKSFKYLNKTPWNVFEKYVNNLIKLRELSPKYHILNPKLFAKNRRYHIDEYTPVILNNVLTEEAKNLFINYYKETISSDVFILGDRQSKRYKAHNESFSRFLHYEVLPIIEHILKKKMNPTYTYLSAYTKGADLPAHTDRPDCEYTVSFVIDKPKDFSWPIYLHKTKQPIKNKGRYGFTPPKRRVYTM